MNEETLVHRHFQDEAGRMLLIAERDDLGAPVGGTQQQLFEGRAAPGTPEQYAHAVATDRESFTEGVERVARSFARHLLADAGDHLQGRRR